MNDNSGNQPWGPNNQGQWQPDSGSDPQSWGSANQQPQTWQSPSQQSWSNQGQQPGQPGPYDGATQTWPAAEQNTWGSANDPNQGQWAGQQQPGQGSPDWNTGQQAQWAAQPPNGGAGGPGAPGGQGGSHKGLGIGIAVVAVVLVAAIGLAFFLVNRNKNSSASGSGSTSANANAIIEKPDAALKDYFDALIKGDSKRALKYGSSTNTGSSKYLTDEMLKASQKANPISGVEVSGDTSSQSSASLSASYSIGEEEVSATYRMYRSGKGSRWQMTRAASDVDLSSMGSDTLKINGISVKAEKISLFPGGYTFDSGNEYIKYGNDDDSTMYVKDPSTYVSSYDLSPQLTAKGVSTYKDLVRAKLTSCLASHKIRPDGCPFYSPTTTNQGSKITEDSLNYSSTSLNSIDSMTPRLDSGTTKAKSYLYLSVQVTGKAVNSSGEAVSVSGYATTTGNYPVVDFGTAKPTLTW
ncbi:hypothetical protein [Acidipropionibacterium virtanenii]|uniref:Uncharacterized protein n=1 Tax=Acidipropionibacterium virtanenii TaxID=2057246 RepID=A0A344UUJ5_9ACTN|nr:hypothetical protein [Acidipropionibacterium virtanenii]AXE38943.1 hypothetical protein JS278_01784 [Acidipropionibacterium virtanenii]